MKTYKFDREGLQSALQHKDYIGIAKEMLENHIEVLPVALLLVLGVSVLLTSPMASAVAYKASLDDTTSMIAFKYLNMF